MSPADFAVNFFVALFALIDPIGTVPLFAAATMGVKSKDSRLIAVYIAFFILFFLTFFYFSGLSHARKRFERMIVPFAMPLLIGPGAISTVIIYASEAKRFGLVGADDHRG